ncbi:unnamed protein product [Rotaria magnacalcarata]|uniref:Uncharacterized protein n=1 Tax=Rotaria magnacalcarata TaxID=392030 RepID=A0A817B0T9_9BILA|nr:unnamed protein product [Rotaria magnacalcarata]
MMNNIIAASAATENEPGAFGQMPSLLFKAFALDNLHIAIKQCEESARIYEMARGLARVNIPETLGNEFSAYADQVSTGIRRLKTCAEFLFELPINDTPVGTLICTPQGVGKYLVES